MEKSGMLPLLAIIGPTAVGKSAVALGVAHRYRGEIVSADSTHVYRYMDIGTAKPTPVERALVPHHLIDIRDPDERFSVADYQKLAREAIAGIHRRGRLPLLVGGSGLYVRAVLEGYVFPALETNWKLRARLQREAQEKGRAHVHGLLAEVDPAGAARIHPNDLKRTIRALEVYYQAGSPLWALEGQERGTDRYDCLVVGLIMDRSALYRRIEDRVDRMMAAGLVDEVKRLLEMGFDEDLSSMQSLGYKEVAGHLKGRYSLAEAVRLLKRNTRRYAKRQLTWFNREPRIHWLNVGENSNTAATVERISKLLEGKWPAL